MTVQDLRPNSQDTSAFYLANIYQVLADPNITLSSIPSPAAAPPPFSPPRHVIWVNSLWFLSLVMSLTCALLATSLHQWARRYLRMAQPARCSPEKRARMRAFFANGVEKMHVPWVVEGLPTLIHLSLFLFFGGLGVFLFNVDHKVFISVVWWMGLFSVVYGLITLLPIIRHDSPYNSPLSTPAWFLYASIHHITFRTLALITPFRFWNTLTKRRCKRLRNRYQGWALGGVEKAAEETASERSSEIDLRILDWTISALGDDESQKSFFEAIPGFFKSKFVKHLERHIPEELHKKFRDTLRGFLGRTWSSNSVSDSEKLHRLDLSMNAINQLGVSHVWYLLNNMFFDQWDEVPKTVGMGQTLARWCTSDDQSVAQCAQLIVAKILISVREHDKDWIKLAARISGLPEHDLLDTVTDGIDSVLLAMLIQAIIRPTFHTVNIDSGVFRTLAKLDICNTLPRLQHDFCTLWNKTVQEAKKEGPYSSPVTTLRSIRHLYIALHQGTDLADPTAFSASDASSYPSCDLASHRPESILQISAPNSRDVPLPTPATLLGNSLDVLSPSSASTKVSSTASQQAMQTNILAGLPAPSSNPTRTGKTGETSRSPNTTRTPPTNPACSSPCSTNESPAGGAASATLTITSSTDFTLSHPREGNEQQDMVSPFTEHQILSTASEFTPTPTLVPMQTFITGHHNDPFDMGRIDKQKTSFRRPCSVTRSGGQNTSPAPGVAQR